MKRYLPMLLLAAPLMLGCPGSESSDDSGAAALLLLGSGDSSTQATCTMTTEHGSTTMPLFTASGDSTVTLPTISLNHAYWTAIALPAVQNGTTVTFSYDPKYTPGGPSNVLVYITASCPIDDDNVDVGNNTPSDKTTSAAGFAATNYSWNNGTFTLTVNATGAGKNLIFISGPSADPSGGTITRNDP